MNPTLLKNASAVVPDTELLVNMVRLRVRQLIRGHRALILAPPGMGYCDVALREIAEKKLTSEPSVAPERDAAAPAIIAFPKPVPARKAA